jgi:dolichol-phosphate mannosyltransferase
MQLGTANEERYEREKSSTRWRSGHALLSYFRAYLRVRDRLNGPEQVHKLALNPTPPESSAAAQEPMSVCFVVPTYNEVENIGSLLRQLVAIFDGTDHIDGKVLVVDDNSPDGTADVVEDIASSDARILLLSGEKNGLGSAYTRGFEYVLDNLHVDAVVQMDADFSHAPLDAIRLIDALSDVDVAIGSRYVYGAEVDGRWGLSRHILSRGGNLIARYVAGIYRVGDCTAGFKAIRVSALRRAFPLRLSVQGYVFQVALLHALIISGARIKELPIRFTDRQAGETKLGMRDVAEFFVHVWWLRVLSRKTFVKFVLIGLSGVVVNLACFQALLAAQVNPYLSSALAIEISIVFNFFLNNYWTFRDRKISTRKRVRGLKFNFVSLLTLGAGFSSFVLLRWLFPEQPALLAQGISILPGSLANYFANNYWTFKSDGV